MADVCVYTANMGGYDAPRGGVDQDIDVDWHYFTDTWDAPRKPYYHERTGPWNVHVVTPQADTPMMEAKRWKMHPPVGYEHAIWIDANMEVTSPRFAREAVHALDGQDTFAVWKHPRRDSLYEEAHAAATYERQGDKYDVEMLLEQAKAYADAGCPTFGLYACGTIVWTPDAWPLAADWWAECVRWTPQDQVSLPFVCWARGEQPAVFPYPQLPSRFNRAEHCFQNRWLNIYAHA